MAEVTAAQLAGRVVAALRAQGHQAWLVGGCVRDLLLRREAKDFDVAIDAFPARLLELFPGAGQVGAHFGVVLVRDGEAQVEVATFRSDHSYRDGRRPETVTFETNPRQDVQRRDFTINAMMMNPATGEVLDVVGGREDLAAGVVRTVGEPGQRFGEDHLRMLRAVRFAARLGFRIDPVTMAAIRDLARLIRVVSAERIRDELIRILTEGGAGRGFALLDESGLLDQILPELAAMKDVPQPPEFHPEGDVWTHTLLMLEMLGRPTVTLALGALLHDVGKPPTFRIADRIRFDNHDKLGARMTVEILSRLRFSNEQIRQVEALVAHHLRFREVRHMRESTLKRFLRLDRFEEHLELHRLDCASSHRQMENYEFVKRKLREIPAPALKPPRLVTGDDLIAEGYQPGPAFHAILETVETAQLELRVKSKREALALVRALYQAPGGQPRPAGT